ncbi:MAG: molybdenum cofactor guanylyltransferase [Thermodesulfobacteriota bacterium]
MSPQAPLAAILAGGRSRRMGADKVSLPLAGVPLLERVWSRVAQAAERVVVVGGPPRLDGKGVPTLPDRYPGADSMGGVATALAHAAGAVEADGPVLCVACDLPFVEPALLRYLVSLCPGWEAVVPRVAAGYEPLCALYRPSALPVFEREIARGNLRLRDAFGQLRTREVGEEELRRFDPELCSFLNVNRPEDFERARRLAAGESG